MNSPIEVALEQRRGVCQDFAHIMTAIARHWGIPCRYVSGYLYHKGSRDRSAADATHAWVEAYLPSLGWVGFDPTNNIMAGERHIRAAVGRDYADVPPTRGTYKGGADSELSIAVSLEPTQAPVRHEDFLKVARPMASPTPTPPCRSASITSSSNSSNSDPGRKKRDIGGTSTVDGVPLHLAVKSEPAWGTTDGDIGLRLSVMKHDETLTRHGARKAWRELILQYPFREEAAPRLALSRQAEGHSGSADRRRAPGHRSGLEPGRRAAGRLS